MTAVLIGSADSHQFQSQTRLGHGQGAPGVSQDHAAAEYPHWDLVLVVQLLQEHLTGPLGAAIPVHECFRETDCIVLALKTQQKLYAFKCCSLLRLWMLCICARGGLAQSA